MGQYEYKVVDSLFSFKRGVRKVQALEKGGWELVTVLPTILVIFGGGVIGYGFILRKPLKD